MEYMQKQSDEQLLLDLNRDMDAIASSVQPATQAAIKKSAHSLTTKQKLEVSMQSCTIFVLTHAIQLPCYAHPL